MKRDIKKYLFDIQTSIQSIHDYLAGERNSRAQDIEPLHSAPK
jgi:hypothetical protein